MTTSSITHAYENAAIYQLCYGHGPAHVAYECSVMLQILDRIKGERGLPAKLSMLELGSGPKSLYRDLMLSFAPIHLANKVVKYLGTDAVPSEDPNVVQWDFCKPVTFKTKVDVVVMPYYLALTLVQFDNEFKPITKDQKNALYTEVASILKPGGGLLVHAPYCRSFGNNVEMKDTLKVPYDIVPELSRVLGVSGLDPSTLMATVHRVDHKMESNVSRLDLIGKKDGKPWKHSIRFSNGRLKYLQTLDPVDHPLLTLTSRYLAEDSPACYELVQEVDLNEKSESQYWNVYRRSHT